jgi:hypothetical protein
MQNDFTILEWLLLLLASREPKERENIANNNMEKRGEKSILKYSAQEHEECSCNGQI